MGLGSLAKQLQQCLRKLHSFTDGQVQLVDCDWEELSKVTLEISPNDGLYKGGRYKFEITFDPDYPSTAPEVGCLTNIFHPNIDLAENGGGVCVSLLSDWTPSNTVEDIIMSLLFLLYNPNVDDPLNEMIDADENRENFEKIQGKIMQGDIKDLEEEYNIDVDEDTFKQAQTAYENLDQCEWDVLAEAAKVEWEYKLEQEKWQEEIQMFETKQKENQIEANKDRFDRDVVDAPRSAGQRTDYAFGKSSLQRCTLAAPCGQVLNFEAPNKDAVLSWLPATVPENTVLQSSTADCEEEEMDCTPPPPVSCDLTTQPSCISWQPFCKTDIFNKPAMLRTLTC